MPLPPLNDPADPLERLWATTKIAPVVGFLVSTLISLNGVQTASLVMLPLSARRFRAFNRYLADMWWGWCVKASRRFNGVKLTMTGDDVPMRENTIVILNHQNMADITFMMDFAKTKDRLGDMKWMVKDPIKYVPGVGWGMLFLDCVFLKRDWAADRESILRTFSRLRDNRVPVWLLSFSEGTRISPEKVVQSQEHAKERGFPLLNHVLLPRPKGFAATVEGLRGHIDAVYDVTLGYEGGVPTLGQFVKGYAKHCHLHVRRFPIEDLPISHEELATWLRERFAEKDALLEHYYEHGAFPSQS